MWSPWISITPSFTVPPVPQAALSCLPSAVSPAASSATPLTRVTALPPRPLVSRETRTVPSPAGTGFWPQVHCAPGWRQPGHMRPASVEYTRPPKEDNLLFMGPDRNARSEEHTSELQSQSNLVCRLLLEK